MLAEIAFFQRPVKVCTTKLSQQMGTPSIQAEMDVEACLQYWQDVGMIEKVGIDNEQTFVFIHKTFGEFAAARHINSLPHKEQSQVIGTIIEQKDWAEVVRFAASSGLGDQICNNLVDSPDVPLALEMLAIATPPPSYEVRGTIIQAALSIVSSVKRPLAFEAGKHFVEVANRFPEEVGPSLTNLLTHHQSWTSLIGWASAIATGEKYYSESELTDAMVAAINSEGKHHNNSLSGFILSDRLGRKILESFILEGVAILLRTSVTENISRAKTILKAPELGSVGFAQKATKILERLVSQDESDKYSQEVFKTGSGSFLPDIKAYNKASLAMFESICIALDIKPLDDQTIAKPKPLLQLSAFMHASHMMEIEASDIYSWLSPHQKDATRETLLGFIGVSGLNRDKLIDEIQLATSYIKKSKERSIFELTARVDAPEPKWETAPTLNLDASKIEAALHHPSRWIIILATYLTSTLLSGEKLELAIQRIFSTGKGQTLWAASKLTSSLPSNKAAVLITERLSKPLVPGCEYLFSELIEIEHDYNTNSDEILRNGLFNTALIAKKAAEYAVSIASPNHASLLPIIKDSYAYWIEHEEPYPTKGGIVPHSRPLKKCDFSQHSV